MYVFENSNHNIDSFTKGLESNAIFSVEHTETSDGSSYLLIIINNAIKARISIEGSFRMFTVVPEGGYLVDQLELTNGKFSFHLNLY